MGVTRETGNIDGARGEVQRVAFGGVPCTNTSSTLQQWHKGHKLLLLVPVMHKLQLTRF
jgi:hypothetical protein